MNQTITRLDNKMEREDKIGLALGYIGVLVITLLLFSGMVDGAETITYQQSSEINLKIPCFFNGTFCTDAVCELTIIGPDELLVVNKTTMENHESYHNYTLNSTQTSTLGTYKGATTCTQSGVSASETFTYLITPSGKSGTPNITFFIFVILLLYSLNLLGFFGKNIPLTIISGMALIFLGVYIVNNGVIIYRDNLTNYLAYITIGWGVISALWAGYGLYEEM